MFQLNYSYPLSPEWSTDEIVDVVNFFEAIERAFEKGIKREELVTKYRRFKEIVPSMSEEKTYFREFEKESGYISFNVIRKIKDAPVGSIIKGVGK